MKSLMTGAVGNQDIPPNQHLNLVRFNSYFLRNNLINSFYLDSRRSERRSTSRKHSHHQEHSSQGSRRHYKEDKKSHKKKSSKRDKDRYSKKKYHYIKTRDRDDREYRQSDREGRERHRRDDLEQRERRRSYAHLQGDSTKDRYLVQSVSFIGEMLRNSKTQEIISKKEKVDLMESIAKVNEKKESHGELKEQGEQLTPPEEEESFTPPLLATQKFPSFTMQEKCEAKVQEEKSEESKAKPRKSVLELPMPVLVLPNRKNVLDLPMPPTVNIKSQKLLSTRTPEMKPEHFKHEQSNFKLIHQLNGPVVVSPFEPTELSFPRSSSSRPRPKVRNCSPPMPDLPDRTFDTYEIIKQIGEGTYGKVFKATDLITEKFVAMKYVRMEKEYEGFPITGLREIKILKELRHVNIIELQTIICRDDNKEVGTYLVFEYMNHDLLGLLDNELMKFDEYAIYQIIRQILEGLKYCHARKILHRDIKCSNILVNNKGEVKLADFGLGRKWLNERPYTNKVISLWYRPIELLLGEEKYGTSIDIWSVGCIFGELFQRRPVFPFSVELDMIHGIFNLCGTPTKNSWPEVKHLSGYATIKPIPTRKALFEVFNGIMTPLAVDLFDKMLCLNPVKRISAEEALQSNWMQLMGHRKDEPLQLPAETDCHEMNTKIRRKKRMSVQQKNEKN